jgi:hypothetical protein
LARIRAEGGLDFDYTINGDELTLIVTAPVPKPPPLDSMEHSPFSASQPPGNR